MTVDSPHGRADFAPRGMNVRLGLFAFLAGCLGVLTAGAQEADSVRAVAPPADTLTVEDTRAAADARAASDTTAQRRAGQAAPWIGFPGGDHGTVLTDSLPVRMAALDLAEVLGDLPGSFLYRFAVPGWPDGWSPDGLPPQRSTLALNDVPFDHLFTGRPGFDIAPLAFIEPPRRAQTRFGRPAAVSMRTRAFATARPLTELKYWKGGDGLESVDVVHAQNRRLTLFGARGLLNLTGTYSGRGSDGEYPGSALQRGRQVQLRLRYERPGWAAELHEMHTRRRVGAHGGVIPNVTGFESIYSRLSASVENREARRRLIRNDLAAAARVRLFGSVTTLRAFWTAETFRYRDLADTVGTATDRFGLRLQQPLPGGITADLHGWTEHVSPRYRFGAGSLRRSELHATARDSLVLLGWTAVAAIGVHAYDSHAQPGGAIELSRSVGPVRLNAGVSLSGEPAAAVEHMGFLALGSAAHVRPGRVAETHARLAWHGGPFDISIRGFGSRTTDARDVFMATDYQAVPDSASVLTVPSPLTRVGAAIDIGWRRSAERGFYGILQPSAVRLLNDQDSELHDRVSRSLPAFFGRVRLGARYAWFMGDLDFDAFVEGHAWSASTSRALHPETGLLAVPVRGALEFGPSSMINVGVDARVRDATFFIRHENVLSGTTLMTGNLIVPIYPLPARRFRFGVFWPILD